MVELVTPSCSYRQSYLEALREGFVHGSQKPMSSELIDWIEGNTEEHLTILQNGNPKKEIVFPDGKTYERVDQDIYWIVDGDTFIGQSSFRPMLNDFLKMWGGHIGYGIRPLFKGQGMGKELLKLTLEKAKEQGLSKLMITCDEKNIASAKIIEANHGKLEKIVKYDWADAPLKIYWIDL